MVRMMLFLCHIPEFCVPSPLDPWVDLGDKAGSSWETSEVQACFEGVLLPGSPTDSL